jgi:hypothetical protein
MDIPRFISENWQLIISNRSIFITFAILIFGVAWLFINFLYKRQIETLKTDSSFKDGQIKYYKELSETKPSPSKPEIDNVVVQQPANNLKEDIRREIQFLKQHAGKALSVKLFERLQPKYDFTVILSEILLMNKNNEIKWAEAPNPPDALSEIITTQ